MNQHQDVFVLLESADEKSSEINQGLLTEGRRIAERFGTSLSALMIGESSENTDSLMPYGLGRLYRLHGDGLAPYSSEVYSWAIAEVLKKIAFELLLAAHTDRGRKLAPRIAFQLKTAAVTGCVDIRIRDERLFFTRSLHGDQLEQEISYASQTHQIISIRPEVLTRRESAAAQPFQVLDISIEIPRDLAASKTLEIIEPDFRTIDLQHANRIVGAGLGCASPKLLGLVEELGHLLECAIGATRPMVDDGCLSRDRMIGQTGKSVSPGLYLALGVSGSFHHLAGIQQCQTVLSVNLDPEAPIFGASDTGFLGDLEILLPMLIARIKQYRDEPA